MRSLLTSLFLVITTAISATASAEVTVEEAVARCSVVRNEAGLAGPVALLVSRDWVEFVTRVRVLTPRFRDTEFSRCVKEELVTSDEPAEVVQLRVVSLHPWATRARRRWADVQRHLEHRGFTADVAVCKRSHPDEDDEPAFTIMPDGKAVLHTGFANSDGWYSGPPRELSGRDRCFARALQKLAFEPSGNFHTVTKARRGRLRGRTSMAWRCAVEGFPCTADAQRAAEHRLLNEWEKRVDCADPSAAVAWLRRQPEVDTVSWSCNCFVRFYVKGPRWATVDWSPDEPATWNIGDQTSWSLEGECFTVAID